MPNLASHVIPSTGGYEIDQSLRFNDDDSAYLNRTPASAGNRKTWTWSGWFKFSGLASCNFFGAGIAAENEANFGFGGSGQFEYFDRTNGTTLDLYKLTTAKFRDPSAWYHIVVQVDTTNATASERVKIWFNGEQITDFASSTDPVQNYESNISNSIVHYVGRRGYQANYFDGYLAEVNFIDGQALDASYFGETDARYGHWKPIRYTGTYGTNGFYLDFSNSSSLGEDQSGNSNNWTSNNLAATDVVLDSPTNNFATLNPLAKASATVLAEGNLYSKTSGSGYSNQSVRGTVGVNSGKHYFEFIVYNTYTVSSQAGECGIVATDNPKNNRESQNTNAYSFGFGFNGANFYSVVAGSYTNLSTISSATSLSTVMNIAVDLDNGYMWVGRDGVWYNSGDPENGTNPTLTGINTDKTYVPFSTPYSGASNYIYPFANFGQDSSFAGNKTAQGNTDSNGIGDFYYAPPSGYLALCTQNLPTPTVAPADHFNTVLYTGNGVSAYDDQDITGVGFQPDFVWIKGRSWIPNHELHDIVRGISPRLGSNVTDAEQDVGTITAFNADGFTVAMGPSGENGTNKNGETFVGWNWKANGTGVTNTDGTITSTVSANVDAGFSIVSYTGNGTTGSTVGHGLSSAPDLIIAKSRSAAGSWPVHHVSTGNSAALLMDDVDGAGNYSGAGYATNPNSTTFELYFTSTGSNINASSVTYIAYCFHSVDGFSKIGSYTGNGVASDGPFVYTGFRPAFVMLKNASTTSNWMMFDAERGSYNVIGPALYPNLSNAEDNAAVIDLVSNGFKLRRSSSNPNDNQNGNTYIFLAFAETPFKFSNGR